MDGVLLVDKPSGVTSHDVVRSGRKCFRQKGVGHAGTLDPAATGLLVLALGKATKLLRFAELDPKRYELELVFGRGTDTDDDDGTPISESGVPADAESIAGVLGQFRGEIDQIPPRYSAVHHEGKRAYELARAGEEFELEPRRRVVHELRLTAYADGVARLEVSCGTGTYMRSLARDIAAVLGLVGHARGIRRTQVGPFDVADAVALEALSSGAAEVAVLEPAALLRGLARVELGREQARALGMGQRTLVEVSVAVGDVVVAFHDGVLHSVVEVTSAGIDGCVVQPKRVLGG